MTIIVKSRPRTMNYVLGNLRPNCRVLGPQGALLEKNSLYVKTNFKNVFKILLLIGFNFHKETCVLAGYTGWGIIISIFQKVIKPLI